MKNIRDIYWITGLFLLPIALIYLKFIPFGYIRLVLFSFVILTIWLVKREGWGLKEIGVRSESLGRFLPSYLLFTGIGIVVVIFAAKFFDLSPSANWTNSSHLVFWFVPMSVAQEFIFRGYYLTKLKSVFESPFSAIAINVLVFALMHVIYPNIGLTLFVGMISGVAFATTYYYKPNLILISLAHTVLNFVAVYYCFFGC